MPYVESQGTLPSRSALTENEERSTMGRCCAAGGVRAGWGKLKHGGWGGDLQQLLVEELGAVLDDLGGDLVPAAVDELGFGHIDLQDALVDLQHLDDGVRAVHKDVVFTGDVDDADLGEVVAVHACERGS